MAIKVWGIINGPFKVEELDPDYPLPESATCMVLCKIELDGEMAEQEIWFESFQDAYNLQKYFAVNVEPLEIELPVAYN